MPGRSLLLQTNVVSSVLILLSRSQQDHLTWAPVATAVILLVWALTGSLLLLLYEELMTRIVASIGLRTLALWLIFTTTLQAPLADAALLLPIVFTMNAIDLGFKDRLHAGGRRRTWLLPPPPGIQRWLNQPVLLRV